MTKHQYHRVSDDLDALVIASREARDTLTIDDRKHLVMLLDYIIALGRRALAALDASLPEEVVEDARVELTDEGAAALDAFEVEHGDTVPPEDDAPAVSQRAERSQPYATRAMLLELAAQAAGSDDRHGGPGMGLTRIAAPWSTLLQVEVTPAQVAQCMIALKLARLMHNPRHLDSWVDVAGYAACGAEVTSEGAKEVA